MYVVLTIERWMNISLIASSIYTKVASVELRNQSVNRDVKLKRLRIVVHFPTFRRSLSLSINVIMICFRSFHFQCISKNQTLRVRPQEDRKHFFLN